MGLAKCVKCKKYIDDGEAILIPIDDNHDAVYCVICSPDDSTYEGQDENEDEYD